MSESVGRGPGCLLCGSGEPGRLLLNVSRPIRRCRSCGLVFADAPGQEPAFAYDESYYKGLVYADYQAERPSIHRNARRVLGELEALVPGRRLLDVGCAAGFFLEAARERGWEVRGVEVSEYASAQARLLGLDVHTGPLELFPAERASFDAVTLWDVIEHLSRPDRALRQIHTLLRPGGIVALSTGDHASLARRLSGRGWRLFSDPTHLFFFTTRTLRRLLGDAGFSIVRSSHRGKWVSLSMIVKQAPLPLPSVLRRALERRAASAYLYANLWDVVTVFATPSSDISRHEPTNSRELGPG